MGASNALLVALLAEVVEDLVPVMTMYLSDQHGCEKDADRVGCNQCHSIASEVIGSMLSARLVTAVKNAVLSSQKIDGDWETWTALQDD